MKGVKRLMKKKKLTAVTLAFLLGLSTAGTGLTVYAEEPQNIQPTVELLARSSEQTETSVAKVETNGQTTYYDTLNEAVKTISDEGGTATITLLQNASLTGWSTLDINGNITLIGGNHTITGDGLGVNLYGTFNIKSGVFSKCDIYNNGTLNIFAGTFSSVCSPPGPGTLNIYGGTFEYVMQMGGTVNIYGGTIGSIVGNVNYHYTTTVEAESVSAGSITVKPLANQSVYGTAEYSLDSQNWQESNMFTGLSANTTYTVYARYKGNDNYGQTTAISTSVTTMKSGDMLITELIDLTGTYGQKLSDVSLPNGWKWENEDTDLTVGAESYPAVFDTTAYEAEYDFINVIGYDTVKHYVKRELTVEVAQLTNEWTSELFIADWTYGEEASTPSATAKYGTVVFSYSDKADGAFTDTVPTEAGTWYVKATVAGVGNYTGLEAVKEFTVRKADTAQNPEDDTTGKGDSGKTETGDTSNIFMWGMTAVVSALGIAVAGMKRRKRSN